MISFDYEESPGTRTSHRWCHFNGFEDGLNKNVDYLLSLFILFAPLLRLDNFNDEKQRPCSKTQQLLCLHSFVDDVIGRLFLTGRSATVTPVGSHFGSGVTKLVL